MAKEREKFVDGCERTGYGATSARRCSTSSSPSPTTPSPRRTPTATGYIAYQTAWLKAHHPVEYLAALLTSVKDDKDKTAVYLAECRSLGIQVLVPDVNVSESEFAASTGTIPFGLSAIRNVGEGLVGHIVAERETNGPFADFYDFCERVDPMVLNKRTVESLIKGGAFDSMGHPRQGLCLVFEQIVDRILGAAGARPRASTTCSARLPSRPSTTPGCRSPTSSSTRPKRLAFEKEMLGLYVSDHPLMGAEAALRRHVDCTLAELREMREGDTRWVGGVVTALSRKYTKKGDLMATFTLEDLQAAIEVMVFPKTMLDVRPPAGRRRHRVREGPPRPARRPAQAGRASS